jgi:hypothetical protein
MNLIVFEEGGDTLQFYWVPSNSIKKEIGK